MGAEVSVEAQGPLKRFMFCVDSVDNVVDKDAPLADYDYYIPVMSLPNVLKVTLDNLAKYFPYVDSDKFIAPRVLPGQFPLKVGIAWASKPGHPSDRSCPLEQFIPLLSTTGVDFYSFQKSEATRDIYKLGLDGLMYDLEVYMPDFYDTACYMKQMDLMISIDSSPLHCAAAMGVSTWGLMIHAAEWRWLLDRADSPWYPDLRLFRQTSHNNWNDIMTHLQEAFKEFLQQA
jgi:hypothetical protein